MYNENSRPHGPGITNLAKKLIWLLIHANDGTHGIIRTFVHIQHILHVRYEFGICLVGKAPIV